jgi:predicted PurR-regulated permease PerM
MARNDASSPNTSRLLMLASVIVVVAALYFARDVLIPVALAILFSFLLGPLVHRLERWRVPRIASVLLVVFCTFLFVGAIGWVITGQVRDLAEHLESYRGEIEQKIHSVHRFFGSGSLSKSTELVKDIGRELATSQPAKAAEQEPPKVQIVEPSPTAIQVLENTIGPLLGPLATAFIVIVLVIFMLLNREDLRDRLIRLVGQGQLNLTTQALDDAAGRVSKYLLMQSSINGSYGGALCIGLTLIGIPTPLLWGLLAGLLRFIPYVGPWMGAAMPILLSLAMPGFWSPIMTAALFIGLELITNSVLEPWLYGASTGVSSIAILVAAVFWAWLWGGVGLILATPLTVCLVVIGKYVPQLEFLNVLLGDEPVLEPPVRYYQRLLAGDQEEAEEVVEEYMKEGTLAQAYDEIVAPALAMAGRDRHHGRLDPEHLKFIHSAVRELIDDLGEQETERRLKEEGDAKAGAEAGDTAKGQNGAKDVAARRGATASNSAGPVLCLPARDEGDEIAGLMLVQMLEFNGVQAEAVSVTSLAGEMVELVARRHAALVCVSALPPSAITHARYLCKRLHRRFGDMGMVVGLWTARGDIRRAKERIACAESVTVVANIADAVDRLRQMRVIESSQVER